MAILLNKIRELILEMVCRYDEKRTNKGVGTQTDPSITGEGLTSLVAKSDGSQTSSGDGESIPVKSVVYKFGKMPRFTAKGSEGDTVKPSTEKSNFITR